MASDDSKQPLDMIAVAERTAEIMGGRDKIIASMEAEYYARKKRWDKDVWTIGRILRAHLYVEHYLTEHLRHTNPQLGDLDAARLTFGQKANLLSQGDYRINFLIPGIKHLNKVRNRLAHNLEGTVTEDDNGVFLAIGLFKSFREAGVKGTDKVLATNPIDVLDEFAEFASAMLHGPQGEHSKAFAQAIEELSSKAV